MLLDSEEFEIIAAATQPYLRQQIPDHKARQIFDDSFARLPLAGTTILELGPGQCDFARLATAAGATVTVIDHDIAVVALGRKRGYKAIFADFLTFDWGSLRGRFDGLYARSSTGPHSFHDAVSLEEFLDAICSVLKPTGWGWLLPWNRFGDATRNHIDGLLTVQNHAFERHGFMTFDLRPAVAALGVDPDIDNHQLFLRGIPTDPKGVDPRRVLG
jgi:hypothetical protein